MYIIEAAPIEALDNENRKLEAEQRRLEEENAQMEDFQVATGANSMIDRFSMM